MDEKYFVTNWLPNGNKFSYEFDNLNAAKKAAKKMGQTDSGRGIPVAFVGVLRPQSDSDSTPIMCALYVPKF